MARPNNVRPLSGRGGAHATPDPKKSIPPPRSAPAVGYLTGRDAADQQNNSCAASSHAWPSFEKPMCIGGGKPVRQ